MDAITLIVAIVALVVAVIAFKRTGGIQELRQQGDNLNLRTKTARERTANMLNRFEKRIRGGAKENEPQGRDREDETESLNKPE